jgi:lipid II:glycine glycyltransferase (peptidoglycan interpeptide bridge formation enzyme)
MIIREVYAEEKEAFNRVVTHPLQSWTWGEFREKTKIKVLRIGVFDQNSLTSGWQITLHRVPKTNFTVGYVPKCLMPTTQVLAALTKIGQEHKCIFIKLEPNVVNSPTRVETKFLLANGCVYGRPLFTKYTFQLDLRPNEEALLTNMHPKTRYNIKVAQKHGVVIAEDNSYDAFQHYLKLTFETTARQKFYAHNKEYHKLMWQTLYTGGIAHLLKATYQNTVLATWIVFIFNNTLYYPYGASSRENREVMASNLMMWEVIRFGKKMGCQIFDMWGSLGPNADPKDPWYGFHRFKEGYGAKLAEFIGTFDLVTNKSAYKLYTLADNLRWKWLRFKAGLPF